MDVKNLTRRVPILHRFLRAGYRRVSGRMISEKIDELSFKLDKIDQLSFKLDKIERLLSNVQVDLRGSGSAVFVTQDSLASLRTMITGRDDAIAIVSILPPERSGVADFTLEAFTDADYPIDFYCPRLNLANYLTLSGRLAGKGARHRVFPLDLLGYGLSQIAYSACIFVLGNSEQNLPVYQAFKQWGRMTQRPVVHLHDPCLWGLFASARPNDSVETILRHDYPEIGLVGGTIDASKALDLGALGSRPLLGHRVKHGIIVNSRAAQQLVSRELPNVPIRTVFHPIFRTARIGRSLISRRSGVLRIGSFGIPHEEKCTGMVLRAFSEIRARRPNSELVIAGFGAPDYVRSSGLGPEQGVIACEPENSEELLEAMMSCHVAVQLRRRNLGESSGIMAQLIYASTPVVAFDVGTFDEYRNAARLISCNSDVNQLAMAIIEEAENTRSRKDAMARLVEERAPSRFCEAFRTALDELSAAVPLSTEG